MLIAYTTAEAPGAWANGTRVRKIAAEEKDAHAEGALGTVLGSLGPTPKASGYVYFIMWDDMPGTPVVVISEKLEALQ